MNTTHEPVMLDECILNLNINESGIYVDCTLGGGGHSGKICKNLNLEGRLIGIDQDIAAIEYSKQRLKTYERNTQITLIKDNFRNIKEIISDLGIVEVDGILADLGVSSFQLDIVERGFSYQRDSYLDMRMDRDLQLTADNVVNEYSKVDLKRIIREYGEEKWANRIADFIVNARKNKRISTTYELVEIIKNAIPNSARREGAHPAKRTFQAIRIEINNELNILRDTIKDMAYLLKKGGRICIITFHSLEDRIVKEEFNKLINPCTCPRNFPICVCNKKQTIKNVFKKPLIPSEDEISNNPRARSAKLRVYERI